MKKFSLLAILMIASFTTFSQDLKPTVHKIGNDTLFCFTIPQAKDIAKRIVKAEYADLTISRLEDENQFLYSAIEKKDSIAVLVDAKCKVIDSLNVNQEKLISEQQQAIKAKEKDLRKARRQKTLLGTILTVVAILAIL